jgi:hypothetical protein
MTPHGTPAGGMGPMGGGGGGGGNGGGGGMGMAPANAGGSKDQHWRTRLCEQFMKEGTCRYGNNCTFAHGCVSLGF